MRRSSHHLRTEAEQITRARRQLKIVGVLCVTAAVMAIWAVTLRQTLARNRKEYNSTIPVESLRQTYRTFSEQLKGNR